MLMLEGEADGIESSIEAILAEGVDLEPIGGSLRSGHCLVAQIHGEPVTFGVESHPS